MSESFLQKMFGSILSDIRVAILKVGLIEDGLFESILFYRLSNFFHDGHESLAESSVIFQKCHAWCIFLSLFDFTLSLIFLYCMSSDSI